MAAGADVVAIGVATGAAVAILFAVGRAGGGDGKTVGTTVGTAVGLTRFSCGLHPEELEDAPPTCTGFPLANFAALWKGCGCSNWGVVAGSASAILSNTLLDTPFGMAPG